MKDVNQRFKSYVEAISEEKADKELELRAYAFRRKNFVFWKQLISKRKLAYYYALRAKDTYRVYEDLLLADNIYIPMSFRETVSEESNPEVNRRVRELAIKKVETEIMILKEKEAKQNAVIDKCNEDIETLIGKAADDIQAKLTDIFMEAVEFEENKSKRIWAPKLELLKNIREREEAKQNALNENRQFRETYARVAQRYSRPQTNSGPPAPPSK